MYRRSQVFIRNFRIWHFIYWEFRWEERKIQLFFNWGGRFKKYHFFFLIRTENQLSEEYIKKYYNYIKEKAKQFLDKDSCLNLDSKAKAKFFASLSSKQLLSQLENLQNFFKMTLEVCFLLHIYFEVFSLEFCNNF